MRIHLTVPGSGVLTCAQGTPWPQIAAAVATRNEEIGAEAWVGPMRLGPMHVAGSWPLIDGCIVAKRPSLPPPRLPRGPRLLGGAGETLAPLGHTIVISRLPIDVPPGTALLVVPDACIDAPHARIEAMQTGWRVTDLGSRNGTAVAMPGARRRRIRTAMLEHGSTLLAGRTLLTVDAPQAASRSTPGAAPGADTPGHTGMSATQGGGELLVRIGVDDRGEALNWRPLSGNLVVVASREAGMSSTLAMVSARAQQAGVAITTRDLGGAQATPMRAGELAALAAAVGAPQAIGLSPELAMAAQALIAGAAMTICLGVTCADTIHAVVGGAPDPWAAHAGAGLARAGSTRARILIDHPDEALLPPVAWMGGEQAT